MAGLACFTALTGKNNITDAQCKKTKNNYKGYKLAFI